MRGRRKAMALWARLRVHSPRPRQGGSEPRGQRAPGTEAMSLRRFMLGSLAVGLVSCGHRVYYPQGIP